MSSKYYPEFYLRRKRQQQVYLRVTVAVTVILIVVLGIVAASYVFRNFLSNRSAAAGATPRLADEQRDLKTQEKLVSAANPAVDGTAGPAAAEGAAAVNLNDIEYAESFPSVSISPGELAAQPASEPAAGAAEAGGAADGVMPEGEASGSAADPAAGGGVQPRAADEPAAGTDPAAEAATRKQEQDRLAQEQAKKEQARKEQAKKDAAKKEQARKDADKTSPQPKPADQPADSAAPVAVRYRVYAGKFLSEEEARQGKAGLGALGVGAGAQIIDTKAGDFLLLVTVLDGLEEATALKGKLVDSGFGGAFVTRKSGK